MGNPIIGVFADTMSCNKGGFGDVTRQYINAAYISAVEDAGAVPFIIPVSNDLEKTKKLIDLCDGLLFPGGEDIDPGYYGENPHKNLGEIRPGSRQISLSQPSLRAGAAKACPGNL